MKSNQIELAPEVRFGQNVVVTGEVSMGEYTSIWHNCVIRGDVAPIHIGSHCNIQDNTVIHGQLNAWSVNIGNRVSVGHSCLLHGCTLEDDSFVGMGSIIMNGAVIGSRVLVAAGSLVKEGAQFTEPNTLVVGRPAKVIRKFSDDHLKLILDTPKRYIQYAQEWIDLAKI